MFTKNTVKKKGKEKHVHVVSFDVPFPANYGGVIDVFYKLKALKEEGVKVHLHAYEYGRKHAPELDELCESVTYYKRNVAKTNLFRRRPYIMVTRSSEKLVKNLLKDNYPILFEGLHTCYHLNDRRLRKKRKIVRTHNIEHIYYLNLAKVEKSVFKRYYFFNEASKLRRFENILNSADGIAAISKNDKKYFGARYKHVSVVSAFHPNEKVNIEEGIGEYALYHGNLSVGENNQAALFLINEVFSGTNIPLVIAGNKPSAELKTAAVQHENVAIRSNLNSQEIYELISRAHVNVLPTFQATGIKLKLLAALYNGKHCIVNTPMVKDTGLEDLCIVRETPEEIRKTVIEIFDKPFTSIDIEKRENLLINNGFSNEQNISKLLKLMFD